MIPLWSGCPAFLTNALQVCQNKAARVVAKKDKSTPVTQLLKQCGWRSVRQEMYYHTVLQVHKTMITKSPHYLYCKLTEVGQYLRSTRRISVSTLRLGPSFQTKLTKRWRGASWYEDIPQEIRKEQVIRKFKKKLDTWVKAEKKRNIIV